MSMDRGRRRTLVDIAFAAVALVMIGVGLWLVLAPAADLVVERTVVGTTPVTVFREAGVERAPVVVIGHGFAGSQQLMQPIAVTLAKNGYAAVTFDFEGHGRNPVPMRGDVMDVETGPTGALMAETGRVADWAKAQPWSDGRLALLGHSMACDILVRVAEARPDVQALVAFSMFSPAVTASEPTNLLVVVGGLEAGLKGEALRVLRLAAGEQADAGTTYGDPADGTGRRVAFSAGVEHIGVLYAQATMAEALGWLDGVFGHSGSGYLDARGPWLGLLFLGIVLLARPLSDRLPVVASPRTGAGVPWRLLWPLAVLPAVFTPLLLWRVPLGFLPAVVSDYLAAHFFVYGALTVIGLFVLRRRLRPADAHTDKAALAVGALAVTVYGIVGLGLPLDRFVVSFVPVGVRWLLLPAMLAGTLLWALADEWLTRGIGDGRFAYPATKLLFVLSLAGAVALDLERLFFLIIISPVILVFFLVQGLFSRWVYARTGHPWVAAIGNAAVLAWAIAVTFPLLAK
ncbi:MAG: alpha/beta fold hydrolase [Geminicoccaceae bacterium]